MFFIIVALVILVLALILDYANSWQTSNYGWSLVPIVILIIIGTLVPVSGYNEPEIECFELVSIKEALASTETETDYYLSINNTNPHEYVCCYIKPVSYISLNDTKYQFITLTDNVTLEIIDHSEKQVEKVPDNYKPTLEIYTSTQKATFWTFALGNDKKSYVIKIPKNLIAYKY